MTTIGFIGLGNMGAHMARNLIRAGHELKVYDLKDETVRYVAQAGAKAVESAADAATEVEFVVTMLPVGANVRSVLQGAGVIDAVAPGTVLIDASTIDVETARAMHEAVADAGYEFLDAPVSGGQQGAENGQLTVMCGGDEDTFRRITESVNCYAKALNLLGPVGSGQLCKMVNQICIAGLVQGLAEGLNFAQRAGLDAHQVVDVISKGAAQSWQMENRYQTMLADHYEHGFAVQWMRKDLAFALEESKRNGSALPVTELVDQFYAEVQALGGDRWDTSSLLARLKT